MLRNYWSRYRRSVHWVLPVFSSLISVAFAYGVLLPIRWAADTEARIKAFSKGEVTQLERDPRIVVLNVNKATRDRLGIPSDLNQLPRKLYLDALMRLREAGCSVLVFALPFDTPSAVDEAFKAEIAASAPMGVVLVRSGRADSSASRQGQVFRGNHVAPNPAVANCLVTAIDFVMQEGRVYGLRPFLPEVDTGTEVPQAAMAATFLFLKIRPYDVRMRLDQRTMLAGKREWPITKEGVYPTLWLQGAAWETRNLADVLVSDDLSWSRGRIAIVTLDTPLIQTPIGARSVGEVLAHQVGTALRPNQGRIEPWSKTANVLYAAVLASISAIGVALFGLRGFLFAALGGTLVGLLFPIYAMRLSREEVDTLGPSFAALLAGCMTLVGSLILDARLRSRSPSVGARDLLDTTVIVMRAAADFTQEANVPALHGGRTISHRALGQIVLLSGEDHPRRALDWLRSVRQANPAMQAISVGVECGPVPKLDGDVSQSDAAIFGSTVRLAANLVGEGAKGDIILGPAMAAEMKASKGVAKVGEKVIRGFESQGPIAIYRWLED